MSKEWIHKALLALESSLKPIPHELQELDWKVDLSPNRKRIQHHLSAFANHQGGGYLVFGINDNGECAGISTDDTAEIVKKLGNIAREGMSPAINVQHAVQEYCGKPLLFLKIEESHNKPVTPKGRPIDDTYIRVAGQTRKATREEIVDE